MKPIAPGTAGRYEITPDAAHTAAAIGNHGVEVVGTPFLIGWLEVASHNAILPSCEPGEATVGTRVEVDHLGPAFPGRPVVAMINASFIIRGRSFTFLHRYARLVTGRIIPVTSASWNASLPII